MQIVVGKLPFFLKENSIDNHKRNASVKQTIPARGKFMNKDYRVLKIRVISQWNPTY